MNRNKFKIVGITVISFALLIACSKSTSVPFGFSTLIDLSGSDRSADKLSTTLWFSTDDGATWVNFPHLNPGQKFKVKVHDDATGDFVTDGSTYTFDWSGSNPKPDDATSATPGFTLTGGSNLLSVKIANIHCAYDASSWTGAWDGLEIYSSGPNSSPDPENITEDGVVPNRFWMDNWWYDGVPAYFDLTPSTTFFDQIVTIPSQSINDAVDGSTTQPCTASGTGTYDQCAGTFVINAKYVIPDGNYAGTYTWQYVFTRP